MYWGIDRFVICKHFDSLNFPTEAHLEKIKQILIDFVTRELELVINIQTLGTLGNSQSTCWLADTSCGNDHN